MDVAPSMVQRSGDKLIVRRVVSGEQVHLNESSTGTDVPDEPDPNPPDSDPDHQQQLLLDGWRRQFAEREEGAAARPPSLDDSEDTDGASRSAPSSSGSGPTNENDHQQQLPQCKIKRNYSCGRCAYFTQNPREYLTHLRDTHGEKIVINECKRCLYASRHYQKLVRHMKMVHGSVDGIRKSAFGSRRRGQTVKVGYGGGGVHHLHPVPKLLRSEADQLTAAYVQQLVASGLPKLLEEIEKSGAAGTSHASPNFTRQSVIHVDLEQLNNAMPYGTDKAFREATNEDTNRTGDDQRADGGDCKPKKRSRPIPNLIPLNASPLASSSTLKSTVVQRFVKPLPLSALTGTENEGDERDLPMSLTRPNQRQLPMTSAQPDETRTLGTKCIYCELSFKTVESLANHIKLAHKEDLIAYLLANSFEQMEAKGVAHEQPNSERTASDTWKRLLEGHHASSETGGRSRRREESEASQGPQGPASNDDTDEDGGNDPQHHQHHQSQTFCGVETAPGYGEVTNRLPTVDAAAGGGTALMKKVFKCPHCSFWASTASRFHVHIVGHLNKKPFECSLCAYRSNWRWDITKHIRLKTIRDPSHKNAGVLMNDETGRRNYTKYNKYIALMQITDK